MTDFYRTKRFNVDPSTFGGLIYNYDFDEYTSMSDIASRIVSDMQFDKICRQNEENRDRKKG